MCVSLYEENVTGNLLFKVNFPWMFHL